MGALYLAALLVGIGCMLLLDHRFRLFFWHDAAIASLITVLGTALFLVWDVAGIALGIFLRGDSPVATGIVGTVVGAVMGAAYVAAKRFSKVAGDEAVPGTPAAPETGKRKKDGGKGV